MANPSLQIGNDNWAIKEDDLLGYSKAGTRFVPEPITMTRASAGTRVNPEGLVETVELLGGELVDCGGFECATPLTYWTEAGLASIGGGVASFVNNGTNANSYIQQNILQSNKLYKITFDVTRYVVGGLQFVLGGTTYTIDISAGVNTYTTYLLSGSADTIFRLKRNGGIGNFNFDVDNVSAKESTKNNLARVDYDGTASSLLAEPERTNLVTYSESYGSGTYFSATNGSVIDNTTSTSPSGENNATQITSTGAGKLQSAGRSLTQNTDYVLSFYAKNVDATEVKSRVLASGGSGGSNLTSVSYISELSTTEWTRITHIFNTGTNTTFYVFLSNALNSGGTIQLWGAQLEEATYATSYIPTDGTTVTRVQDQYEKTGISDLINSEEGVLFIEMAALSNDGTARRISINDGSFNNIVEIGYTSAANEIKNRVKSGGGTEANMNYTATDILDDLKIALKWKVNDFAVWVNGVEVLTDTSGAAPIGLSAISFDRGDGTQNYFGKVKQLQIYKTALSDDELTILTGTSGVHFYPSYAAMASVLTYKIE